MNFSNFSRRIRPYIPFTALNTVWRRLDNSTKSILEVGCGRGQPMSFINRHKKFYVVGIDIFAPYLRVSQQTNCYDELILADIRKLPFKPKSFDIILAMEVLEHLEKEDGERFLEIIEEIAIDQVILSTPIGKYQQGHLDGNPYQEHKCIWQVEELQKRGYKLKGTGVIGLPREEVNSGFLKLLRESVYILGGLFSYNFPGIACHVVAQKRLKARKG